MFKKLIILSLSIALSLTGLVENVKAEDNKVLEEVREVYTINEIEYQMSIIRTTMNLEVRLTSDKGDSEVVVYNYETKQAYYNGREIEVSFNEGIVRSDVVSSKQLLSSNNYNEVLYAEPMITLSDVVTTLDATLVLGATAISMLAGVGITAPLGAVAKYQLKVSFESIGGLSTFLGFIFLCRVCL